VANQALIIWLPRAEWWEQQRDLIISAKCVNGVTRKTTIEEYRKIIDMCMEYFQQNDVPFMKVDMNPSWVKQELQATRKPMTRQEVAAILYDPIGIERIGFKIK
jgi:hypothetical protein